MHIFTKIVMAIFVTLAMIWLSACSASASTVIESGSPETENTPTESPDKSSIFHQITISVKSFSPQTITIGAGDTVVWLNTDDISHSMASLSHFQDEDDVSHLFFGEVWVSPDILPGQSYSYTFKDTGTFEYICLPLHISVPRDQYFSFTQEGVGFVVVR
jgi:plastocyanin